jgi:hypothetical protein
MVFFYIRGIAQGADCPGEWGKKAGRFTMKGKYSYIVSNPSDSPYHGMVFRDRLLCRLFGDHSRMELRYGWKSLESGCLTRLNWYGEGGSKKSEGRKKCLILTG